MVPYCKSWSYFLSHQSFYSVRFDRKHAIVAQANPYRLPQVVGGLLDADFDIFMKLVNLNLQNNGFHEFLHIPGSL